MSLALSDQKQMHLPENHRCYGCEKCYGVSAWNFDFLGCYHKPYKGKWIEEIKVCPKKPLKRLLTDEKDSEQNE